MSVRSILKNIGNAFKAGWNNGNLLKGTAIAGQVAATVGLTGSIFHEMSRSGRCHHHGGCGGYGGGFGGGIDPYFIQNPMNNLGTQFGQQYMSGNSYMLPFMGGNLYTQQSMGGMPYGYLNQIQQQQITLDTQKINYSDAGRVSAEQDKTKGEELQTAIHEMGVEQKGSAKMFDLPSDKSEYKTEISNTAKSYIAKLDTDGDGYVSKTELVKFLGDGYQSLTDELFKQINLYSTDNKIDWKELASFLAAIDANNTEGKHDGTITHDEIYSFTDKLSESPESIKTDVAAKYKGLFGSD